MNNEYWNEIVEACYRDIYSYAYRIMTSVHDAEEVTQDTFLQAFKSLKGEEKLEQVRPWLFKVARNKCIDRKRWWKRWSLLKRSFFSHEPKIEADTQCIDFSPINALPKRQKEILLLRHWHGFSTAETAKILGINEGTVKSHLKRAVEKVKLAILERNDKKV
ncbi:MAG: RNA polymerase sigma factor [SAR324 cluster bacterium]|uniref:RNA polymerase sigma factor n=1 Tax=SAR324 cluster bacterium TaxID=2024889 RepID=A0A7X9FQW6_9DELT|nr:RNA polymerase sigma factor [SAR324 cluster bacterium]